MNQITREAFQDFCQQVQLFAVAVSSVAGTDATGKLMEACQNLDVALAKDETIAPGERLPGQPKT